VVGAGGFAGASALDLAADLERSPLLAAPDESPSNAASIDPTTPGVDFGLPAHIERPQIPWLCGRLGVLAATVAADRIVCDVGAVVQPDAVTVDALARLQLTARRSGREIRLKDASRELDELLHLTGLAGVIRSAPVQASRRGGRPKSGK